MQIHRSSLIIHKYNNCSYYCIKKYTNAEWVEVNIQFLTQKHKYNTDYALKELAETFEYIEANFDISDGIYGSVFFMSTGFHGFHVIIGTIFIIVCFFRHIYYHFTKNHHLGFECAAWYWHFVDVVWLFLFITIYWWGNSFKFNIPYFSDIFYIF